MLLLVLSACLLPPEAIEDRLDADGDGFEDVALGGTDCNDSDATIYPGAEELCEAIDRNCDGLLGTDDADGDGFPGCEECNDDDPSINPDGQEVCDDAGVDEDCDGLVNDADDSVDLINTGTPHWPDADGDGLGDIQAEQVLACASGNGLAAENSDCNDDDRWIPMRREWCRNGIDDDCEGAIPDDTCRYGLAADSAAAHLVGEVGDGFGFSVAFVPDVDGDGAADIAVGVPKQGPDDYGVVNIYPGTSLGEVDVTSPIATITGARPGDALGAITLTADWRHDGTQGLVVAAPGTSMGSGPGTVYLLDAPAGSQKLTYDGPSVVGTSLNNQVWMAGLSSVLVTDDTLMVGFSFIFSQEAILAGYQHPIEEPESLDDADWTRVLSLPYNGTGQSVSLDDLNGDGESDLAVGSSNGEYLGIAYGPFTGHESIAFDVEHESGLWEFGEALAVFDLDGDGSMELAVTGRGYDEDPRRHILSVVTGFSGGELERKWTFIGSPAEGGETYRQSLSVGGDLDDDGDPDLVWGQPEAQRAWLLYSNFQEGGGDYTITDLRDYNTHLAQSIGTSVDAGLGRHVLIGPDANGDGRSDILIASQVVSIDADDAVGEVSLLWGGRW